MSPIRSVADLSPGDHISWLYTSEEEHRALLTPFLRQGLERGEKVIYYADNHSADTILGYLRADGLAVETYLTSGQLGILAARDVWLRRDVFSVDEAIALLARAVEQTLAEGYPALRVTDETTWSLANSAASDWHIAFEARLATVLPGSRCLALCQYDRRRFAPSLLLGVLAIHPYVAVGTAFYDNAYGSSLASASADRLAELALEGWLKTMANRQGGEEELHRKTSELEAIIRALPDMYFHLDSEGKILDYKSSSVVDLYLLPPEFLGKRVQDVLPPEVRSKVERAIKQALAGDAPVTLEYALPFSKGERVFEARLSGLQGREIIVLVRNISQRKRAEVTQHFLAEASRVLSSSLGYEMTLTRVARLAVPTLADACLVSLSGEPGPQPIAVAHADPLREDLLVELQRHYLREQDWPSILRALLRSGRPYVVSNIPDAVLPAIAHDPEVLEILRELALESAMFVPLITRGQTLGLIIFLSSVSGRHYTPADLPLAEELARRAAQAIDNARLYSAAREARAVAEMAEQQKAFLAEASKVLASSLDYESTLASVARLAARYMADWCVVSVVEEDGTSRHLSAARDDRAREELLAELLRTYPPDINGSNPIAEALRTGQPSICSEMPDPLLATLAHDASNLELLRRLQLRSGMIVPLIAGGRTLGTLALMSTVCRRHYDPADLALAEELGHRCALAIDNARLYRQAQEAIRARDEFLSVAAHELKTPVTSLRGFAQLVLRQIGKRGSTDPEQLQRALAVIDQQSDKLTRLVSQLLDISRIEHGQLAIERQVADVADLVRSVVAATQARTEQHRLLLQAPSALPALVDPLRFEQVVINLLDNALKFSPADAPVEVELSKPDEATLRLAVRDHGIGISPGQQQLIFDRLYRAHSGNHYGGLGLGLYISRRIVELHGGSIEAISPPDGGACLIVHLPAGLGGAAACREGEA